MTDQPTDRAMTSDEQLWLWLDGQPVHREGECCPDFSCCRPDLLVPRETREAFIRATPGERDALCMGFLGALFAGESIYIAGGPVEES